MTRKLLRNRGLVLSSLALLGIIFVGVAAPYLAPHDYRTQDLARRLEPPSRAHPLGTDELGRDVLSRLLLGARVSLQVGILATGLSLVVGLGAGLIAGFRPGSLADMALQGLMDVSWAVPTILLALFLATIVGPGLGIVILSAGLGYWAQYGRLVRAQVLSLREETYMEAAKAVGCGGVRLITRYVLPNVLPVTLVVASLSMAQAIIVETSLSFLGVGAQAPTPSWGLMLSTSRLFLSEAPWVAIAPGAAATGTILVLNLLGDSFRDALDPYLKKT